MTQVSEKDRDYLEIEQDLRKRYRKIFGVNLRKANTGI